MPGETPVKRGRKPAGKFDTAQVASLCTLGLYSYGMMFRPPYLRQAYEFDEKDPVLQRFAANAAEQLNKLPAKYVGMAVNMTGPIMTLASAYAIVQECQRREAYINERYKELVSNEPSMVGETGGVVNSGGAGIGAAAEANAGNGGGNGTVGGSGTIPTCPVDFPSKDE